MSKKDKSKFRKQIKAQLMQEISQTSVDPKKNLGVSTEPSNVTEKAEIKSPVTQSDNGDINLPQIRYDLKKTGVVVGVLALITLGFYFADLKYGVLLNFGDWLFKTLNIN